MKYQRAILPLALVLLAACGGPGPTPTPPTTPPTTPAPPTPPVTPPTQPPDNSGVPYYGEWAWSFVPDDSGCCDDEGRYSIVQTRDIDPAGSGFGFYQTCYQGNCYGSLEGGVIMGPGEGNTLTVTLFRVDSAGDFVPVYAATDDDGQLPTDDQGRQVFEGRATSYDNIVSEVTPGRFRAILTDLPTAFPPFVE